jgi:hypothetical protein
MLMLPGTGAGEKKVETFTLAPIPNTSSMYGPSMLVVRVMSEYDVLPEPEAIESR